ncbi:MAG TPA: hypothetical protein VFC10_15975 [Terriglobia bacterium]|nr:hypothetical protein [Terriglobia bacterium]
MCSACSGDYEDPEMTTDDEGPMGETDSGRSEHVHVSPRWDNTFCAYDDRFDIDWDGERFVARGPIGEGDTEQEAIEDLLQQERFA